MMTEQEAKTAIQDIPIGSKLQLVKTNGDIIEVVLASQEVNAEAGKDYGDIQVPELPAAITVQGKRWGAFRIEVSDLVKIARIG